MHVKTLSFERAVTHRFLLDGALYFHDIRDRSRGGPVLRGCFVIQLQYGPPEKKNDSPGQRATVPGIPRRRKILSGEYADTSAGMPAHTRAAGKHCLGH
jgi:hypothetical protein